MAHILSIWALKLTQKTFTSSKLTKETLKEGVKYVES